MPRNWIPIGWAGVMRAYDFVSVRSMLAALLMNPRLFQQIADKLNRDARRHNGVTAEQVANVASGEERCESHPVIQSIRAELHNRIGKHDK